MTAGLVVLAFSFIGGMLGAWVIARPDPNRVVGICQTHVTVQGRGAYVEITAVRADGSLSRTHVVPLALTSAPLDTVFDFDPNRKTWEQR